MTETEVLNHLSDELAHRQLPCGGWAALPSSIQPAVEPTCYAALALGTQATDACERAHRFFLQVQNPNGSWPVFAGDDQDGCWVTSLVAIALRDVVAAIPARLSGLHWLLSSSGKEGHWLWKWKFRTADRHVQFDPNKYGWPWIPNTVSWVVPTAFATVALNQLPCSCGGFELVPARVERGVEMLLDRVCPGGGWNAGNGVVYGEPVAAHPDDTAIALLALSDRGQDPIVGRAVQYLEHVAPTLGAPWSLAWSILALAAHRRPTASVRKSLLDVAFSYIEDTSTLALVCLALNHQHAMPAFGVSL